MVHKNITVFRIGISLVLIGAVWTGVVFSQGIKESKGFDIKGSDIASLSVELHGKGIGFYTISTDKYNANILTKVLDSYGDFIDIKRITNKVTVNYFEFGHDGKFTLEMKNLSDNPIKVTVVLGDTRYADYGGGPFLILSGACVILLAGYIKLRHYMMAQPEENS